MAALDLMVERLADVMQQARAARLLDVDAQLPGHEPGQPGDFQAVGQYVLAVGGAVLQPPDQLDEVGVQAVDAQVHDRFFALALHLQLKLAAALVHRFLDAGGVDAAVRDQALQRQAGDLAAGLVKARQRDGLGRVVNDEVAAGGGLQRADVAAFAADDAALHLIRGQRHDADGGFAGGVGRAAGDGLADHLAGDGVAFILHVGLVGGHTHGFFVGQLVVDLLEQHGAGVLLRHGGDGFELFDLAQLELFQLVQAGFNELRALFEVLLLALHGGGALVQRLLLLVHAALLAADLGTAVLDLLVGLRFQAEGFVLGFNDGLFAFLFG